MRKSDFHFRCFGMLYNVYTLANPVGSVFFSGILAGYLYDREAAKQNAVGLYSMVVSSESTTCTGAVCFRLTFLIMSAVCVIGVVLSVILSIRTRIVYKTLYERSGKEDTRVK
mgnify:CR=1 FL=1